ncbi:retrotransposon protein, putative, ty1-copia subclass [Tanacetum coccineum]|uniref:Retrotransposon protein, putative, ty1-copia subclass n=1 Tax=Tanacetum coccineum TaxID=301880 RepID=A0ABQ5C5M9_9ASTR
MPTKLRTRAFGLTSLIRPQGLSNPWQKNFIAEDKLNYLEHPIPVAPVPAFAGQQVPPEALAAHAAWVKGQKEILKTLFSQQAEQELLQTVREFQACKQEEGQSVSSYVLKMKIYIDNLERLGHPVSLSLAVSLILVALLKEHDSLCKTIICTTWGRRGNNHEKGKYKLAYAPKPKIPPSPKKDNPVKDAICHQCGDVSLEEELGSKKLKAGVLSLYMGDGHRATVEAIGSYHLCLPSGLVLVLHNCHYAPSITRGIILVSRLYDDGFINRFGNNTILVSRNNVVYFSVIPRNGIFEIDLFNSITNDCSMYVVSNKRAKTNLDSTLLWHCHLGHISKKRIEKFQHDGLLNSTDNQSFDKCISCMSGKMAQKPYTHQVERAKDLLGLIHTNVYGPFRTMSKQGASYFVTFTDDFSCYGYVYLLKHKHEVFETFKVFQKEVENQLGKTIKSLRYDRGGEYMSQEFLDHLKEHGIIAHRTPPYTPQYNGVSERRNRTLLDMVCFMMSQTTLAKSFWDYALESAARILNMVPTKKVKKTPYEVWHGSIKCIFIGYPKETIEEDTHPSVNTSLDHDEDDQEIDEPQSDINPIRRSTRTRRAPDRMCLYIDAAEHEFGDHNEPANYKSALLDHESEKCLDVINVEMQSIKDNEVWDLVDLPPHGKTVGSKWLFKKKTDMDGVVHTYKARLVAKGFTQTYEVDYEETFSPIANTRAIRILVAIVAFYGYEICQMDVKTAFLNGLKQASRQWNK